MCSLEKPMSDASQSSVQSPVVCEDFVDLQRGQIVNSEAIRCLSETIVHITSVISQFQSFMDKYKVVHDSDTTPNIASESLEYGNRENVCDGNKAINDSSFVLNDATNHNASNAPELVINTPIAENRNHEINYEENKAINNSCSASNASVDSSEGGLIKCNNNQATNAEQTILQRHKPTYANIVSSHEFVASNTQKSAPSKSPCGTKTFFSNSDGFIGVERKRRKIKKFFLTGIAENVNENQIFSYLNKKNIIPTYISIFLSRRRGVL